MSLIKSKVSRNAVEAISKAVFSQEELNYYDKIELVIVCDYPFVLRELVLYLKFTDRIYGRLLD